MLLPINDHVLIQWEESLGLLRFQWVGPAGGESVRPAFARGRDLVVSTRATRALIDFTGLPPLRFLDEVWLARHWLPVVLGQALEKTALVFPRQQPLHHYLAAEAPRWCGRRLVRLQLQFFDDAPGALRWLSDDEDGLTVRRLQAEWLTSPALSA